MFLLLPFTLLALLTPTSVLGQVCTELDISPAEQDVRIDSCLNIGWEDCDKDQDTCTKFSDLFGRGWNVLSDVTEQMADSNDESKGRLPVYGKLVGDTMMYLYFSNSGIVQGRTPGQWVFGRTIGSGYGGDREQCRCGVVPTTCYQWVRLDAPFVNSNGDCLSPTLTSRSHDANGRQQCNYEGSHIFQAGQDRRLPYQRDDMVYQLIEGDYTKSVRCGIYCGTRCRSFIDIDGEAVQQSPRDITFSATCVSTDLGDSIAYEDQGVRRRSCILENETFNEDVVRNPLYEGDCRVSRCDGCEPYFNSEFPLGLCESDSNLPSCQCNMAGRNPLGGYGIEAVMPDPSLS